MIGMDCKNCNSEFLVFPSNLDRQFCSHKCYTDFRKYPKAEKHPNWNGGMTEFICEYCGCKFKAYKTHKRNKKVFCSNRCANTSNKTGFKKGHIVHPKSIEFIKKYHETHKGKDHPRWKGGIRRRKWIYGSEDKSWDTIREEILSLDNHKCVVCGNIEKLNIHHFIPFRYEGKTETDNLVTLCQHCHRSWESFFDYCRKNNILFTFERVN